ncbi:MAG: FeoA family protein, partial [Flavobacteriales bacterium]
GTHVRIATVKDGSDALLHLLDQKGVGIGKVYTVLARLDFDSSVELTDASGAHLSLSEQVAAHLWVEAVTGRNRKNA